MGEQGQAIISLEQGWNEQIKKLALDPLEHFLDDGFKTASKTRLFSNQEYARVYTICYNMCTQKAPYNWSEQLYQKHGETISAYLTNKVVPALKGKHGEHLLAEFVTRGENHNIMNQWHQKFFMYLDRYHVKYHNLPSLLDAGLRYFKNIVFDGVKKEVTEAIIDMINDERGGAEIPRDQIKSCIQIYEKMGMKTLDAYINDFEAPLLVSTRAYYSQKGETWLAQDSTPAYLLRVEQSLEAEKARVTEYLNSESESKILAVLDSELLAKRESELLEKEGSGCKAQLTNDMFDDLSRMYRLFSRIPNGLDPIAEIFKQHIIDMGTEKIEQRLARVEGAATAKADAGAKGSSSAPAADKEGGGGEKESSDDPQFIKDMLAVHEKYLNVANKQFMGNTLFQKALKDAFNELVNRDVGRFKTAELISSFCDRLLKTGSGEKLSDTEIEEFLEKTVQLFSYLTDQDLFAEIYRNQLARRLLNQRSASDDMERLMISKLKLKCGAQFTAKMEGMLNDLSLGIEHSAQFERFCKDNPELVKLKVDFSVQVLTTGHWPGFKPVETLKLPVEMQHATKVYREYYDTKVNHRRLQWTYTLGNCNVRGVFGGGKRVFDISVTTLQGVVMHAFNKDANLPGGLEGNPIKFKDLEEFLGIPEDFLKKVLHSLACGKFRVLKRTAEGSADGEKEGKVSKGINVTDVFAFNDAFTCPTRKFRIPQAVLEESHNPKRVEEDRSIAIEAAIVRIMKARLTLGHQQLIAEVLSQLAFFRPDPKLIKRRIEALIDRDYLERDPENNQIYRYLA